MSKKKGLVTNRQITKEVEAYKDYQRTYTWSDILDPLFSFLLGSQDAVKELKSRYCIDVANSLTYFVAKLFMFSCFWQGFSRVEGLTKPFWSG